MEKKDITDREDIILLVDTFYEKVKNNAILGYIFDDIAKINWETHLEKMYSFWSSMLIGEHSYTGNPMKVHIDLGKIAPMGEIEFMEWLVVFHTTIDELFEGKTTEFAKERAENISRIMQYKIEQSLT
ncbi:MAG: group III truncated hemoglobin [Chitinophagales bacterium]|nr:group III truncated hemoglobin [Chitinophagales bacterium]MCZ2393576.1 group III truncated hemoglobin [Chitinophagales bacterium]